ncbi:uncharacterized protein LOC110708809 [Chenopodium quinoa]|uniref:uncharacterized protein LOC110708809 n=1 Tax=Chenopodium quinoa TaxID=63459 RepID=UPI000B770AB8|nr:uncharacterized protein LOC110708809 [Chenopodium quinoa]
MKNSTSYTVVVAYVDDLLITGTDADVIQHLKVALDKAFKIKDLGCNPTNFPLPKGLKLSVNEGVVLDYPEKYKNIIGKLLYLSLTMPDISYAVQQLSTLHYGFIYPAKTDMKIKAYSDAEWGTCADSRRSLSSFCVFLGNALVSWKTKK